MAAERWITPLLSHENCTASLPKFLEVTDVLLERPNLNSTHLFRADILFDSTNQLETITTKQERYNLETNCGLTNRSELLVGKDFNGSHGDNISFFAAPEALGSPTEGLELKRSIVRQLIPRKPQVDRILEQSCYIYQKPVTSDLRAQQACVVYVPHVDSEEQIPWYHPCVKALAYFYAEDGASNAQISMHIVPFRYRGDISTRLERTLSSLNKTIVRLMRMASNSAAGYEMMAVPSFTLNSRPVMSKASAFRDTIIPQHIVQDTYTRLKQQYAADLISRWVEKTDPSKHVFEDLSIASFLIELWKKMYAGGGFPGFVDIACGNGVLVYILKQEGYHGYGFDARRRQTWEILGLGNGLQEKTCIPKPFLDTVTSENSEVLRNHSIHNGIFKPGTFIISNHADELTLWTPILATLSSPKSPLPFLAIPCCSHALDGSKHRFTPKDAQAPEESRSSLMIVDRKADKEERQPSSGDLKVLRMVKAKASTHDDDKSAYSCLTRKTVFLAEELGYETEQTLMRIPSTRNIGIVGNRKCVKHSSESIEQDEDDAEEKSGDFSLNERVVSSILTTVQRLLERECAGAGGIQQSAGTWIEKTEKLHCGQGRGKVNLRGRIVGGSRRSNND